MGKIKKCIGRMTYLCIVGCLIFILSMRILECAGIQSYIVRSGSMEPAIMTGSVCFVDTRVQYEDIRENDVIAFEHGKIRVTHRVTQITEDGFITKGDNNDQSDGLTTNKGNYIGKSIFVIPWLGYVLSSIQTLSAKIIIITLTVSGLLIQRIYDIAKK